MKLSRMVLSCSERTGWDGNIVASARSEWLGLLLSTVAEPHRTTSVLARTHPMWLPQISWTDYSQRNYKLSTRGEAIPCCYMASRTPGRSSIHFEESSHSVLLTPSWQLTQGSGSCKVGVRTSLHFSPTSGNRPETQKQLGWDNIISVTGTINSEVCGKAGRAQGCFSGCSESSQALCVRSRKGAALSGYGN